MLGMRRGEYTLALGGGELQCLQAPGGQWLVSATAVRHLSGRTHSAVARGISLWCGSAARAQCGGRTRGLDAKQPTEVQPRRRPRRRRAGWLGQEQSIASAFAPRSLSLRRHRCSVLALRGLLMCACALRRMRRAHARRHETACPRAQPPSAGRAHRVRDERLLPVARARTHTARCVAAHSGLRWLRTRLSRHSRSRSAGARHSRRRIRARAC